jgi:hypothetical protein
MTRASTIIEHVIKDIQQRVQKARTESAKLQQTLQGYQFEQQLIQSILAKAESVRERDEWEFEMASLECVTAAHQQEIRLLEAETQRNESLLRAAKRHRNP